MNEEILKVMKDIQATPQLSKEVVDDDSFVQYIDNLCDEIESLSRRISVEDFLQIVRVFTNEGMYFGLDRAYLEAIETMPNYPPPGLFLFSEPNGIVVDLRARSIYRGEVPFHTSLSNFVEAFEKYTNTEIPIYRIIDESLVSKSSLHERRLLIELIMLILSEKDFDSSNIYLALYNISLYIENTPDEV